MKDKILIVGAGTFQLPLVERASLDHAWGALRSVRASAHPAAVSAQQAKNGMPAASVCGAELVKIRSGVLNRGAIDPVSELSEFTAPMAMPWPSAGASRLTSPETMGETMLEIE